MSGRRQQGDQVQFLTDTWEFNPLTSTWRRRADVPRCVMAGTGTAFGQSHLFVLGGDDGSLFFKADELQDEHPGLPREAFAYHTITDTWVSAGPIPQNQVTTVPVLWDGQMVIASGDVRPRVRTASVWTVRPVRVERECGTLNYCVLVGYLLTMVGIGIYFARRNKNTDDYFRGGKHIPWWAGGCSIFATMLSSLTYTGIPSKAFAQDWVYAVGNMMIPLVAFVAVYVALPFYRRLDATSARLALWVVVIGAIGQNVSTYTADQAVVQRYMTTPDEKLAARSIWANAILTIRATILFFGIGTALFAFYRSHPEKLDPTITTDQIFPLFIAREMPVGVAGLIVAGVFSAAQSTVSTSMNSTATTVVTDFMRPFGACRSDRGYLWAARIITLTMGVLGTAFGVFFVDPEIKSLFDAFIKVVGLFMGVLGGLFVLGVLTRRANAFGALAGALTGAIVMFYLWRLTDVNGYLNTVSGITSCVVSGYLVSVVRGGEDRDLRGLTIYTDAGPRVTETE